MRTHPIGISLIEVLAAIFVVSVGLLGVLAVIPFGAFQVSRANQAGYTSNMLINAVEEIALRKLAMPETWEVNTLETGTPPTLVFSNNGTEHFNATTSTLNCTRILWVETRGMRDIPPHIFTIGSTFDNWSELMRGQDDLVQTMNEESDRPQLVLKNGKPMSSGTYEWCFTYKPVTTAVTGANGAAGRLTNWRRIHLYRTIAVEETETVPDPDQVTNPGGTIEVPVTRYYPAWFEIPANTTTVRNDMNAAIAAQDYPHKSPFILNSVNLVYLIDLMNTFALNNGKIKYEKGGLYYDAPDPDETLSGTERSNLRTYLTSSVGSYTAIAHDSPVDVIACYQRAPDEDMLAVPADFDITYSPASRSGTITFHDSKFLQALQTTKYVFLTWGTDHALVGGTWCRIVFLAKGEQPKIIITGDLSSISTNNLHVYIPSGAVYHKHIENMPIWEH